MTRNPESPEEAAVAACLLKGGPLEQDLLGLLTAARGGLSIPDLRELTGADLVAVEEILHSVAGRIITRRLPAFADDGPQVYLLGHEELQSAACHYLGHDRLTHYRDRLHAWAESYRTPTDGLPWPPHTPEYLLTSYPRMLAVTGDSHRLTLLALGSARHDRMLELSGGDTAALAEIKTCQDLLLASPQPDLYALARLSHQRSRLESRNARIPAGLPAVWAALGQPDRAEAPAHNLPDPGQQVWALVGVARALAAAGDSARAEALARAIADPDQQVWALVGVARALAAAGDPARACELATDAEHVARTIADPGQQVWALVGVARALAAAGDPARACELATDAEHVARTIADPDQQVWALVGVARALAAAGDSARAEALARAIADPDQQVWALVGVARALAAAGDPARACELATDAEHVARTIADPDQQVWALVGVARALAAAGDPARAEALARAIADPDQQVWALVGVARALAAAGDPARACELATDAEHVARTIADPDQRAWALVGVARALAAAGDPARACELATSAEHVARTIADPGQQAWALTEVAKVVGLPRAGHLMGEAFALGAWLTPLPVLATLHPQEVIRIADAIYADELSCDAR
ncbi:hypothetical protein V1460_04485 [Streptomyces sp. SCSIO 30461]|uniref:hypothetical protein n=1 Tax=Streptomyces sp. SCSIO 30461 TaxID=3118085 RepID=UPI0030D3B353